MGEFEEKIEELQQMVTKLLKMLLSIRRSSVSGYIFSSKLDEYLKETEKLCISSRLVVEKYRLRDGYSLPRFENKIISNIIGNVEVTEYGWLHISLNTLLPSLKYNTTNYIGDTISRMLDEYPGTLPYFEQAYMAIVEFCNFDNHTALDNDNKCWKMIPNTLKGRVIKDDTQFYLSLGLFTKVSQNLHCEIFVLPQKNIAKFVEFLDLDV